MEGLYIYFEKDESDSLYAHMNAKKDSFYSSVAAKGLSQTNKLKHPATYKKYYLTVSIFQNYQFLISFVNNYFI